MIVRVGGCEGVGESGINEGVTASGCKGYDSVGV